MTRDLAILQAVSESIMSKVEQELARRAEGVVFMQGNGWNVRSNGLPLFAFPVDHRFALSVADSLNVSIIDSMEVNS
jgi:hypothetical protein